MRFLKLALRALSATALPIAIVSGLPAAAQGGLTECPKDCDVDPNDPSNVEPPADPEDADIFLKTEEGPFGAEADPVDDSLENEELVESEDDEYLFGGPNKDVAQPGDKPGLEPSSGPFASEASVAELDPGELEAEGYGTAVLDPSSNDAEVADPQEPAVSHDGLAVWEDEPLDSLDEAYLIRSPEAGVNPSGDELNLDTSTTPPRAGLPSGLLDEVDFEDQNVPENPYAHGTLPDPVDLSGLWIGTNYFCEGQYRAERVVITHEGDYVAATKSSGDRCVPAGYITFRGTFYSNLGGMVTCRLGTPESPASSTTTSDLRFVNGDTIEACGVRYEREY